MTGKDIPLRRFVSKSGEPDEKQTQHVEPIQAARLDIDQEYHLSEEFEMMLVERQVRIEISG
jgi:hypothetical protein